MKSFIYHTVIILFCGLVFVSCGEKGPSEEKKAATETKVEKQKEEEVVKPDYLSAMWAVNTKSTVDHSPSEEEKNKRISEAAALEEEGKALYKKGDYGEALKLFEKAIESYPTGVLYFEYGDTLYEIPRPEEAIKAYETSIELGYEQPHYSYFNIACLYSLINSADRAFENLEKAVEAGYKHFDHMGRDADLEFLRSQPEWKERFAYLQSFGKSNEYRKMIVNKTLTAAGGSSGVEYSFCDDGNVVFTPIGASPPQIQYGTWKMKGSKVIIHWNRADVAIGVGEPQIVAAGGPVYAEYKIETTTIDKEQIIDLANVEEEFKDEGFVEITDGPTDCSPKNGK